MKISKLILVGLAALCLPLLPLSRPVMAQDGMMMPPPKELNAVAFLMGNFTANMTFHMGPETSPSKGTIKCVKALGGMWIEAFHTYDMGGMKMLGRHLLTYDPAQKMYVGYWFDQAAPGAMELSGKLNGNTLTLISKPVAVPGMEGMQTFRATYVKKDAKHVTFRLETKAGAKWEPAIVGTFTKK